jgi:hypothetical protein
VSTNAVDTSPKHRVPRSLRRATPWLAGLLLVTGVVVALVHFIPSKNAPPQQPSSNVPAKAAPAPPKAVRLSHAAVTVARQFVKTAVARQNLAAAWKISGPDIRGGLTYKEWLTGAIPVIPYPLQSLATARFKIDYSHRNDAVLEVALLPKSNSKTKGQVFVLGLKQVAGPGGRRHWVVDNWVPKSSILAPSSGGG